jgi:hypothetical protein
MQVHTNMQQRDSDSDSEPTLSPKKRPEFGFNIEWLTYEFIDSSSFNKSTPENVKFVYDLVLPFWQQIKADDVKSFSELLYAVRNPSPLVFRMLLAITNKLAEGGTKAEAIEAGIEPLLWRLFDDKFKKNIEDSIRKDRELAAIFGYTRVPKITVKNFETLRERSTSDEKVYGFRVTADKHTDVFVGQLYTVYEMVDFYLKEKLTKGFTIEVLPAWNTDPRWMHVTDGIKYQLRELFMYFGQMQRTLGSGSQYPTPEFEPEEVQEAFLVRLMPIYYKIHTWIKEKTGLKKLLQLFDKSDHKDVEQLFNEYHEEKEEEEDGEEEEEEEENQQAMNIMDTYVIATLCKIFKGTGGVPEKMGDHEVYYEGVTIGYAELEEFLPEPTK